MCASARRTKRQESTYTGIRSAGGINTRKFSLFAASFVVATGVFGAWMLTTPVSEAAVKPGVDVSQFEFNAPVNLPSFDDKYQRHIGVLDVFVNS
jgi:hypothetical protein